MIVSKSLFPSERRSARRSATSCGSGWASWRSATSGSSRPTDARADHSSPPPNIMRPFLFHFYYIHIFYSITLLLMTLLIFDTSGDSDEYAMSRVPPPAAAAAAAGPLSDRDSAVQCSAMSRVHDLCYRLHLHRSLVYFRIS